ncbi:MAG TPA: SRPBCC family protein [Acidimicrobiaceae bacterium]|nr:SRPBCC family protein [Acidimicrobiaceae bacterium]
MAVPTSDEAQVKVDAPPEVVYDLVADLSRMGEWSPECYRTEWVGEVKGPVVGAEFLGHNRVGPYRWSVGGKVVTAQRPSEFAFTTYLEGHESTRWRYRFQGSGDGTVVTESYEYVWSKRLIRLTDALSPRKTMLRRAMRRTLERIKAAAEAAPG